MVYQLLPLFQIAGAGLLGLGIYILGSDYGATQLSEILGNDLYQIAAYALIVSGATLIVISLCGCCGALRESRIMLGCVCSVVIIILFRILINFVKGNENGLNSKMYRD